MEISSLHTLCCVFQLRFTAALLGTNFAPISPAGIFPGIDRRHGAFEDERIRRKTCQKRIPRLFGKARATCGSAEKETRSESLSCTADGPLSKRRIRPIPAYLRIDHPLSEPGEGLQVPREEIQNLGGRRSIPGSQAREISTTACITCSSIDSSVRKPVSVSRPIASSICSESWPAISKS